MKPDAQESLVDAFGTDAVGLAVGCFFGAAGFLGGTAREGGDTNFHFAELG